MPSSKPTPRKDLNDRRPPIALPGTPIEGMGSCGGPSASTESEPALTTPMVEGRIHEASSWDCRGLLRGHAVRGVERTCVVLRTIGYRWSSRHRRSRAQRRIARGRGTPGIRREWIPGSPPAQRDVLVERRS